MVPTLIWVHGSTTLSGSISQRLRPPNGSWKGRGWSWTIGLTYLQMVWSCNIQSGDVFGKDFLNPWFNLHSWNPMTYMYQYSTVLIDRLHDPIHFPGQPLRDWEGSFEAVFQEIAVVFSPQPLGNTRWHCDDSSVVWNCTLNIDHILCQYVICWLYKRYVVHN